MHNHPQLTSKIFWSPQPSNRPPSSSSGLPSQDSWHADVRDVCYVGVTCDVCWACIVLYIKRLRVHISGHEDPHWAALCLPHNHRLCWVCQLNGQRATDNWEYALLACQHVAFFITPSNLPHHELWPHENMPSFGVPATCLFLTVPNLFARELPQLGNTSFSRASTQNTLRLSSHSRLNAFVIQNKLN